MILDGFTKCRKPDCFRKVPPSSAYCCAPCSTAGTGTGGGRSLTDAPEPYVVLLSPGTPETGLWCPSCLLPSRVRLPFVLTDETGSSDAEVPAAEFCERCGDGL